MKENLNASTLSFLTSRLHELYLNIFPSESVSCKYCLYILYMVSVRMFVSNVLITLFGCEEILVLTASFSRVATCICTEVKSIKSELSPGFLSCLHLAHILTYCIMLNLPGARTAASCPHQADVVPEPGRCSWQ